MGPANSLDETLSRLYWQAKREDLDEDWSGVLATTGALLAQYPNSVLALLLKAGAQVETGDPIGGKATYNAALQVLLGGQGTRTPLWADARMKDLYAQNIRVTIDSLP